ncbi:hypothetical protein ACFOOM_04985 [Streptomyces echinoruber]|uniref:CdiI immunity protein domain-containing protein n=1 Tax=Streptomyces echinoruber TaxID=68898 RepID=A0A918R9U7_9ACTN|nr:hypothetical protein [Streptomyces echinoruber]GGZ90875.1 hypothetical protein GCM10010389_31670 [Streptomyces echinoruber]
MKRHDEFTFGVPWITEFFHQDWTHDAPTAAEAVARQFPGELDPAAVLLVRRDARLLLDHLAPDRIEVLWEACTAEESFFPRRAADGAEWMRRLTEVCDRWLSRRADTPALSDADSYEGRELAGPVLAEVEEFRSVIGSQVADALTECARRCTPDLAFRFLLKVLPRKYFTPPDRYFHLTREHYARLEDIGTALRYGEFVVSEVKYLVEDG